MYPYSYVGEENIYFANDVRTFKLALSTSDFGFTIVVNGKKRRRLKSATVLS